MRNIYGEEVKSPMDLARESKPTLGERITGLNDVSGAKPRKDTLAPALNEIKRQKKGRLRYLMLKRGKGWPLSRGEMMELDRLEGNAELFDGTDMGEYLGEVQPERNYTIFPR